MKAAIKNTLLSLEEHAKEWYHKHGYTKPTLLRNQTVSSTTCRPSFYLVSLIIISPCPASNQPPDYVELYSRLAAIQRPNLISGSTAFSGTWRNSSYWTSADSYTDPLTGTTLSVRKRSATWSALGRELTLNPGIYTFSLYAKVDNAVSDAGFAYMYISGNKTFAITPRSVNNNIGYIGGTSESYPIFTAVVFTRSAITFIVTEQSSVIISASKGEYPDSNYLYLAGFKLEEGLYPTPWCE